jgi:hypothetical protein
MPYGPGTYGTKRGRPSETVAPKPLTNKPLANRPLDSRLSPVKKALANRQLTRRT